MSAYPTARARDTRRSPSPSSNQLQSHAPHNSRDKKRHVVSNKLKDMMDSFTDHHVDQYAAQLQAIQCDLNLIIRADPYRNEPLDDSPADIDRLTAEARHEVTQDRPFNNQEAEDSFRNLCGKNYAKFVDQVNGAMEERDKELTMLFNRNQDAVSECRSQHDFKVQMAREEHALLSNTIRDRLIQQLTSKKAKLLKEKEQLDIADSNALLFNPAQFNIGNPIASPGGAQNRKTRNTRYRPGDVEDLPSISQAENKRKRKAAYEDNDNGSPAPANRISAEGSLGSSSSYRELKRKIQYSQFEAPIYSLDSLFSEKELAITLNRAHSAATDYFNRSEYTGRNTNGTMSNGQPGQNDARNGSLVAAERDEDMNDASANTDEEGSDEGVQDTSPAPPAAVHATRSTYKIPEKAGAASYNPLNDLANTATAASALQTNLATSAFLPTANGSAAANAANLYPVSFQATTASKANSSAPSPPGAPDGDVQFDLAAMKSGFKDVRYSEIMRKSLEKPHVGFGAAIKSVPTATSAVRGSSAGTNGAHLASGHRLGATGGLSMGRTTSAMGALGGATMERSASGMGGVAMSKSSSLQG